MQHRKLVPYRRLAYLPDRRSTRIEESVDVSVSGFDASGKAYHESVSTMSISCHGCRYVSENQVSVGDMAILEVVAQQAPTICPTLARVRSVKGVPERTSWFEVAVELEFPRNVWGVESPPADWAGFEQSEISSNSDRKLHALLSVEQRENQTCSAKPSPIEMALNSRITEDRKSGTLPPLLAQMGASPRQPVKTSPALVAKTAPIARSSRESLDEICSRLESKVSEIFDSLIASFAVEIALRSKQAEHVSSFEAFERGVCSFERPAASSTRRSA